jgi:hypothetical protein
MLLLLLFILLILLLPVEAQEGIAQAAGVVVTHPLAPYFVAGALGAGAVALLAYAQIWNALAYSMYLDDVKKADETYQRRKK